MRKIVRKYKGGTKDIKTYQEGGMPSWIKDQYKEISKSGEHRTDGPIPPPAADRWNVGPTPPPAADRWGPPVNTNPPWQPATDPRQLTPPNTSPDQWRPAQGDTTQGQVMQDGGGIFGKDYKKQNKKHKLTNPGKRGGGKQYRRKAGK